MKAILWDVDGTIAETERDGHRVAFNQSFAAQALSWQWSTDLYGELLAITGGRERILHYMESRPDAPRGAAERDSLARSLHAAKNAAYARLVAQGRLTLRPGVRELMEQCRATRVAMAITTTTSRANVEALMAAQLGPSWHAWFDALVCGEDVARKKPDPEAYLRTLDALELAPHEAVAIEDSPNGAAAARAAGIPVVVTRSAYFTASEFGETLAVGPGLHDVAGWQPAVRVKPTANRPVGLDDIAAWHRGMPAFAPTSARVAASAPASTSAAVPASAPTSAD